MLKLAISPSEATLSWRLGANCTLYPKAVNEREDSVAIAVPIYRPFLTPLETERLRVTLDAVGTADFFFIGPQGLDWSFYSSRWRSVNIECFDDANFASVSSYNEWMLQTEIYERFQYYEFLLVCQTDAILTKKVQPRQWEFDFLGAPWNPPIVASWNPIGQTIIHSGLGFAPRRLAVGNGGLSLRRTKAFLSFVQKIPVLKKKKNEDVVISYFAQDYGLVCAPQAFASKIFMEEFARFWQPGNPVPDVSGFHGLHRVNPELESLILGSRE